MHLKILAVGENKVGYLVQGEADYLHRMKRYCRIEMQWVPGEKIGKKGSKEVTRIEGEKLLKLVSSPRTAVVLDRRGEMLSSEALAKKIAEWQNEGKREIVFIIGGTLGLSDAVLDRADFVLSLSKMTFTHEMVRLILLEQLYRSYTILRGEKYHK